MKTLTAAALLLAALTSFGCAARAAAPASPPTTATTATTTPPATRDGYVEVNGLRMYYQVHGVGRPIVMLHGALCTIEACLGSLISELAKTRQVLAFELQAHGRTADIDRPLTPTAMADDVAAAMAKLGVAKADVFGYSMGAGVALQMGIRHPQLVDKLVLQSVALTKAGFHPGLLDGIGKLDAAMFKGSPMEAGYLQVSSHGEAGFARLVHRVGEMNSSVEDVPAAKVKAITAPVLLIAGDSDMMTPEHIAETFRLVGGGVMGDLAGLPRSQLAVLPGTTHMGLIARHRWVLDFTSAFLDAPAAKR